MTPPEPESGKEKRYDLSEGLLVLRDLWALGHAMERTSRRMHDAIGITAPQRMMIRILGRQPGVSAGQLARLLHVDAGTVSAALARLEGRGLLERKRDPRDNRRVLVRLTRAGKKLDIPRDDSLEAAIARALDRSTSEERELLRAMLVRITDELNRADAAK